MKLISKIVCASSATMTIIYSKKRAPWPFFNLFKFRFDNIQNNRDSIFIIISNNTLMSISWVATYNTILLTCKFSRVIWGNIPIYLFLFHFHILLLLLHCHYETSIGYQLIMTFRLLKWFLTLFLRLTRALPLYFMMTRRWGLRMTWFVSLTTVTLWLASRIGSPSLFLRVVPLRVLNLNILLILGSPWLISHTRTCSKSVYSLRLLRRSFCRRVVVSL